MITAALFPAIAAISMAVAAEPSVVYVDAREAAALLEGRDDITILDVRTAKEFAAGHLEGAVQVDYYSASFADEVEAIPHDGAVLVHCRSGGRSRKALDVLKTMDVETIYHMDGGYIAWTNAGLPIAGETE